MSERVEEARNQRAEVIGCAIDLGHVTTITDLEQRLGDFAAAVRADERARMRGIVEGMRKCAIERRAAIGDNGETFVRDVRLVPDADINALLATLSPEAG